MPVAVLYTNSVSECYTNTVVRPQSRICSSACHPHTVMNCHTMGGRNQPPACSPAVTSYLPNLGSRQLSHDPLQGLSRLQEQCYGLPSVVRRLSLQHRLEAHEGCVNCINFSGSGQLLASGSDDLHVVVWDWERGRMVSKLESGHISNIFQVCTLTLCILSCEHRGVRDQLLIMYYVCTVYFTNGAFNCTVCAQTNTVYVVQFNLAIYIPTGQVHAVHRRECVGHCSTRWTSEHSTFTLFLYPLYHTLSA